MLVVVFTIALSASSDPLLQPASNPAGSTAAAARTAPQVRKRRAGVWVEANMFRVEADSRTGMAGSVHPATATPNYDTE